MIQDSEMRTIDAKQISQFNTRMGMFICPSNKENVIAFIHGYEYGTQNKCLFTKHLKELLENKYQIKYNQFGWPNQIERLAEKREITWMEAYLMVSFEIINQKMN